VIHCDGICKCKGQVLVGEPDSGFDDENIDETSSDSSNSTAFKKKDAHGDRTIVGLDDGDDAHDCEIDRVNDIDNYLSCRFKCSRKKPVLAEDFVFSNF